MSTSEEFYRAIQAGDTSAVARQLERSPALLRSRDPGGQSPVLFAVYRGKQEVVDLLRTHGAELDLFEAAAVGDAERVSALLAADADTVSEKSADGWTPLHLACFFGRAEAAHRLLDAGADVGVLSDNPTRNTPLHAALAGVRDAELIRRLIDAGAEVNAVGGGGLTPLHLAAARGDIELIEMLLAAGARSTQSDAAKWPEDFADERGHPAAAARLRSVAHD